MASAKLVRTQRPASREDGHGKSPSSKPWPLISVNLNVATSKKRLMGKAARVARHGGAGVVGGGQRWWHSRSNTYAQLAPQG